MRQRVYEATDITLTFEPDLVGHESAYEELNVAPQDNKQDLSTPSGVHQLRVYGSTRPRGSSILRSRNPQDQPSQNKQNPASEERRRIERQPTQAAQAPLSGGKSTTALPSLRHVYSAAHRLQAEPGGTATPANVPDELPRQHRCNRQTPRHISERRRNTTPASASTTADTTKYL